MGKDINGNLVWHLENSVKIVNQFMSRFFSREDGQLLLADFTKTGANHHGFELAELENKLIQHGFSSVHSQILYSAEDLFQGNYSELFFTVAQKSLA